LETGTTEKIALPERLEISSEIIKSFGTAGLELTMTSIMENKKRGNYVLLYLNQLIGLN
jgi:hypothetical protein